MKLQFSRWILFCMVILHSGWAVAAEFALPNDQDDVIGEIREIQAKPGDTLAKIARREDIGFYEIKDANPLLPANKKLSSGTLVKIPNLFILPGTVREGIVVNLSEFRIYYYPKNAHKVITEPVGIGKIGWLTPTGTTKIIEKRQHPSWRPPVAVREDAAKRGHQLPDIMPPGPDNPLGDHMFRLGWYSYLIHGTNKPQGVGRRVTSGCILMYPEDIKRLFPLIPVGTRVTVMDKPIKIGRLNDRFLVEVHKPLIERGNYSEKDSIDLVQLLSERVKGMSVEIFWQRAHKAIKAENGMPTIVGRYYAARVSERLSRESQTRL